MILLTGWSGNTGNFVLKELLEQYSPEEIVGITRNKDLSKNNQIIIENVDLDKEDEVRDLFERYNFTSIIHIANIRYSPLIMDLANTYQVPRAILVHTTGIYSKYRMYSQLYKEIEEKIKSSSYPNTTYTILRPTMIYGNERDHNMHKLIKFLSKFPVFPIFGTGSALMQPVHVEDLAHCIILAHANKNVENRDYDLSGGSVISYKDILKLIEREINKKILFIHIPIKLAIFAAKIYSKVFKNPIISVEQVERLQEDKSYSNEKARKELGYSPRTFESGIISEVSLLKEKGLI